jgi:hypothetical protein
MVKLYYSASTLAGGRLPRSRYPLADEHLDYTSREGSRSAPSIVGLQRTDGYRSSAMHVGLCDPPFSYTPLL